MDNHALRVLEYEKVLARLAEHCATEIGAGLALSVEPTTSLVEAERMQAETAEARRLMDSFGGIPLGGLHNLAPLVEKALMTGVLMGEELRDIHGTLLSAESLRKFLKKHAELAPALAEVAGNLILIPSLAAAIGDAIDDAGEVRDSASERLARLRRDLRTVAGRIQEKLNSIIQSSSTRDALQDPVVVTRHGRWCVPVRSEHKGAVPGIVHDSSASGATLFVEPKAVVDLGNKLREVEGQEREEVERILRDITARVTAHAADLRITNSAVAHLDLASAKARLAEVHRASEPRLRTGAFLSFRQARHPLLQGEVVPIDVHLGRDFKGLLITGPNTGGKTVTLKTVGLLTLMALSGLQIPAAEGSECGVFQDIFADIGDEQSIEQSLSTFSSHVRNIVHTLLNITPRTLVLFDELGAGTDPAEGAALAAAVLQFLAAREVCVLATTHYGELKTFAFLQKDFENASVEFDPQTLKPTYRLLIGIPGASHALHIASRLGMPEEVLEAAREAMGAEVTQSDELIQAVEQSRLRALEEEKRAEQTRRQAEKLRGQYEEDIARLSKARSQVRDQLQSEAQKVIRDTQAQLEGVLRELRSQKRHSQNTEGLANKAKRLMRKVEQTVEEAAPPVPDTPAPVEAPETLQKGDKVRIAGLGAIGTLLEDPEADEAVVQFGSMEARIGLARLEFVERPAGGSAPARSQGGVAIGLTKAQNVSPEIMLRGQRVDEALQNLDRYLDDVCLAGLERVRVIHGKGTGAIRRAVWDFMKKHPAIGSLEIASADEGGEGATIAHLK